MVPITPTQRTLGPLALDHQSALLPVRGPVIERVPVLRMGLEMLSPSPSYLVTSQIFRKSDRDW